MKAVMVMFDSLNRHFLPPYGPEGRPDGTAPAFPAIHAPNFTRLARRALTFENSYVCSMPCMPARRDLHTGRPNFLHRSWGPIEPFDDSMPQMLNDAGVHSCLITDHQHYWEDGGCTYHNRYSTYQFHRGQEGDPWIGQVAPEPPENALGRNNKHGSLTADRWTFGHDQDRINRKFMPKPEDAPQARTFAAGVDFIDRNHADENWFLQIETFDPHEPFFASRPYRDLYAEHYEKWAQADGRLWDWPDYRRVAEHEAGDMVEHMRTQYAALVSQCDKHLGDVLDAFDRHGLWEDTMLFVWTDHGFLLGENDYWAKMRMPWWNYLAQTPLFVHDPRAHRSGVDTAGARRKALVQPAIDAAPTILGYFGVEATERMTGHDLAPVIADADDNTAVRGAAVYGTHGGHVNVTDGRYTYMCGPAITQGPDTNRPLYDYTLMPTHMKRLFTTDELGADRLTMTDAEPFNFTKGCRLMRIAADASDDATRAENTGVEFGTLLYDLDADPGQTNPLPVNPAAPDPTEARMVDLLKAEMTRADAPAEQYERLGLR